MNIILRVWEEENEETFVAVISEEDDRVMLANKVPVAQVGNELSGFFQQLKDKDLSIKGIYIPLWSSFHEIVHDAYPNARILIDYNE